MYPCAALYLKRPNWSLGTDTQLQDAASRLLLRAGQLRR